MVLTFSAAFAALRKLIENRTLEVGGSTPLGSTYSFLDRAGRDSSAPQPREVRGARSEDARCH